MDNRPVVFVSDGSHAEIVAALRAARTVDEMNHILETAGMAVRVCNKEEPDMTLSRRIDPLMAIDSFFTGAAPYRTDDEMRAREKAHRDFYYPDGVGIVRVDPSPVAAQIRADRQRRKAEQFVKQKKGMKR